MALTTVIETSTEQSSLWTPRVRRVVGWTGVAAAVAAAGLLAVQVAASDTTSATSPAVPAESQVRLSESITAIDHRAEAVRVTDASQLFAQRGSITAIDHRAEAAPVTGASDLTAANGSITAIDHRAESGEPTP